MTTDGTEERQDAVTVYEHADPDMYERVYFDILLFLGEALGAEEDGGGGLEADVRLLAAQRDEARAEAARLRGERGRP